MSVLTLYRVITVADGAVNPAIPPVVATVDLTASTQALNTVQVFITPVGAPVLELWSIVDGAWYYLATITPTAGRPAVWTIENVPATEIAVIAVTIGGQVSLSMSKTE